MERTQGAQRWVNVGGEQMDVATATRVYWERYWLTGFAPYEVSGQ